MGADVISRLLTEWGNSKHDELLREYANLNPVLLSMHSPQHLRSLTMACLCVDPCLRSSLNHQPARMSDKPKLIS